MAQAERTPDHDAHGMLKLTFLINSHLQEINRLNRPETMTPPTTKICTACIHCLHENGIYWCRNAPRNPSPVTGESRGFFDCETERTGYKANDCGPEGRNFAPKAEEAKP